MISVGLIAQLVERRIGIPEAMGSNPSHVFISFSAVEIYDISYIHLYLDHLRVYYELTAAS